MQKALLTSTDRAKEAVRAKLPSGFAEERSHKASQTSNEHSRAAAQACLLINGGAATAVLAYLAKDKIDPTLFNILPGALLLYSLGVASAACMLFFATEALDEYNKFWFWRVTKRNDRAIASYVNGDKQWRRFRVAFGATIVIFLVSNVLVAAAILWAPPPQNVFPSNLSSEATDKKPPAPKNPSK
jgi:hypothetical protein